MNSWTLKFWRKILPTDKNVFLFAAYSENSMKHYVSSKKLSSSLDFL